MLILRKEAIIWPLYVRMLRPLASGPGGFYFLLIYVLFPFLLM
nr:MAG TPA: hypothetical protein [Caudoviricetes sp.]